MNTVIKTSFNCAFGLLGLLLITTTAAAEGRGYYGSDYYPDHYYHGYPGWYDRGRNDYSGYDYWRERRETLDRERARLAEERQALERERNNNWWSRSRADERCPSGFKPSENKCTPQERKHGCKDIRLSNGLGCVNR